LETPSGKDLRDKHPGDTKTDAVVPVVLPVPNTDGRAKVIRIIAPGTAANHVVWIFSHIPNTTVSWSTVVTLMPRVLDPLPDIAADIV